MTTKLLVGYLAVLAATAHAETLGFSVSNQAGPPVTVVDDQTLAPLPDAQIIVTSSPSGKTVTATKEGYAGVTVMGVTQAQVTLYLKHVETTPLSTSILSGGVGNYQVDEDINQVRAAFVMGNLSVFGLLHFNLNTLISPIKDTIDAWGTRKIPSNIIFPKQSVGFLFPQVDLDKETYRLPLPKNGNFTLASLEGQMSLGDLLGAVTSGDTTVDILNKLQVSRMGLTAPQCWASDATVSVPTTVDLQPGATIDTGQSPFDNNPMVIAVTDLLGDRQYLIPSDIKVDQSVNVKFPSHPMGVSQEILALAMDHHSRQFSGIIDAYTGSAMKMGDFLVPETPADYATLPASVPITAAANSVGMLTLHSNHSPIWYVYALPGVSASFPTAGLSAISSYAILHLEFDDGFQPNEINGISQLQTLHRFSRSESKALSGCQ